MFSDIPLWHAALTLAGSYLSGAVPYGLILALAFCRVDPRKAGSGNIGTTNVARLCGKPLGLATLLLDALKGLVPVWLAVYFGFSLYEASAIALCAVLGHMFPVFLKFKGGKGVATTVGIFVPLALWQLAAAGVVCLAAIFASGFVSLGSLVLIFVLNVILAIFGPRELLPLALIILALIVIRHRENIGRLLRGQEKPWQKKAGTQKDNQ